MRSPAWSTMEVYARRVGDRPPSAARHVGLGPERRLLHRPSHLPPSVRHLAHGTGNPESASMPLESPSGCRVGHIHPPQPARHGLRHLVNTPPPPPTLGRLRVPARTRRCRLRSRPISQLVLASADQPPRDNQQPTPPNNPTEDNQPTNQLQQFLHDKLGHRGSVAGASRAPRGLHTCTRARNPVVVVVVEYILQTAVKQTREGV